MAEVLYEERDRIAIIAINRPDKKNTLTDSVIRASLTASIAPRARKTSRQSCCAASAIRSPPATT